MIRTNKLLFVGDPHLDSSTPSSRVDDYASTSIEKLYALKNLCLVRDVKAVVLLGDVFNKHDQSNTYLNKVMKVFSDFKKENIEVYTIVGNHDLSFERMDTLPRSPLQMLFTADLIKHLDNFIIDTGEYTVRVQGLDYPDDPVPLTDLDGDKGTLSVLCAHRFFNYAYNDPHNLTSEDCVNLGYTIYAMGHDHMQYDVDKNNKFWVVRPGSFMRTSSHQYNMTRGIAADEIQFAGTKECPQVIFVRNTITSKPASEVFSTSVFQRSEEKSLDAMMETLHERVGNMLAQMDVRHDTKDIYKVLDEICTDPEVKACIETYLSIGGYSRR